MHLQEFPKPTPNLDFLARLKKTLSNVSLSQLLILLHLGKIDQIVRKYTIDVSISR